MVRMIIGHGQYGKVFLADHEPVGKGTQPVAVKLMKPGMSAT